MFGDEEHEQRSHLLLVSLGEVDLCLAAKTGLRLAALLRVHDVANLPPLVVQSAITAEKTQMTVFPEAHRKAGDAKHGGHGLGREAHDGRRLGSLQAEKLSLTVLESVDDLLLPLGVVQSAVREKVLLQKFGRGLAVQLVP